MGSFVTAIRISMYFSEDRLKLATEVLKLQKRVHNLRYRKPKTEEARERNNEEIEIAKQKYEEKKYELLIMCARKRFVEDVVELALL